MLKIEAHTFSKKQSIILGIVLVGISFIAFVFAAYSFLPVHENANPPITWGWGVDWKGVIRDASLKLISGQSPYIRKVNCFPPWAYLLLSPIALLSPALGAAILFVLTYTAYSFVLFRMKVNPWAIFIFMLNGFTFINAKNADIDFLSILGLIMPPQIGLFFILIKPQIGIGVAIFWLIESWRKGKFKEVLRVFSPVIIGYSISFLIYGFWPINFIGMTHDAFNASLWPFGIIIGIFLLFVAIRERKNIFSVSSTPFLSPYVNITSYAVSLIPLTQNIFLLIIGVIFSWL